MTIAIASGKGGTGKTMLAVSLASILSAQQKVTLMDLDVEEPNAHLFFDMPVVNEETVWSMVPEIDEEHCSHCGTCQKICAFHALLCLPDQVLVFPELCKGCRGCVALCPDGAMRDGRKMIGVVETRKENELRIVTGRLHVGETAVPALIRSVKAQRNVCDELYLMDAPPGTACAAVEAVRDADYSVLVAESTPFGLHDLELMVRTLRALKQPFGVVINKAVSHDRSIRMFCAADGIDILGELPTDENIARACARGEIVSSAVPHTLPLFKEIIAGILQCCEVAI